MARTLRAEQHQNTEDHHEVGRKTLTSVQSNHNVSEASSDVRSKKQIIVGSVIGLVCCIVVIVGTSVFHWYFGYPFSNASKHSVRELIAMDDQNIAIYDENVKSNRDLADQNAVLRSQISWLKHSHNVFKAVLLNDESRLLRGGAWEFAKTNWKQSELDFVTSHFDKTANTEEVFKNREAHQQNKLLFMSSMLWDNVDELAQVNLSELPPGWVQDYPKLLVRLEQTGATNVLDRLDAKHIGIDAAEIRRLRKVMDTDPLGSGQ